MVKHIVLWKMKESSAHGSRKEACAHIKFELESLKNEIEGLVHIEVEPAFNEEGILALYSKQRGSRCVYSSSQTSRRA